MTSARPSAPALDATRVWRVERARAETSRWAICAAGGRLPRERKGPRRRVGGLRKRFATPDEVDSWWPPNDPDRHGVAVVCVSCRYSRSRRRRGGRVEALRPSGIDTRRLRSDRGRGSARVPSVRGREQRDEAHQTLGNSGIVIRGEGVSSSVPPSRHPGGELVP